MITIQKSQTNFEREPLRFPFGFKGGYTTQNWQSVVLLQSSSGAQGVGVGVQGTLWSDAQLFTSYSEAGGNSFMFLMTSHAAKLAEGRSFAHPQDLLDSLLPELKAFGDRMAGRSLRTTFALNALVPIDNAAWQLYAAEQGTSDLMELIPADQRAALSHRHEKIANIPLLSYGIPVDDARRMLEQGWFFLKIKIGSDPAKDGDPEKMLAGDSQRLSEIHQAARGLSTPYTDNGKIPYYLDANGRYDSKERLQRLLDHAEKIGALDHIVIVEEPFAEENKVDVRDLPVRIAADESAHSDADARERIELGYGAIALKPIAKTLSMSLRVAKVAYDQGQIPCFCADLTVNPLMADWNKNIAARLAPLPGLKIGAMESNGHQNYTNWEAMKSYHPSYPAPWIEPKGGIYQLSDAFYTNSGGIFESSPHYLSLVTPS